MLSYRTGNLIGIGAAAALGLIIAGATVALLLAGNLRGEEVLWEASGYFAENQRLIGNIEQMGAALPGALLGDSQAREFLASEQGDFRVNLASLRQRNLPGSAQYLDEVERAEAAWYALLLESVAVGLAAPDSPRRLAIERERFAARGRLGLALENLLNCSATVLESERARTASAGHGLKVLAAVLGGMGLVLVLVLGVLFTRIMPRAQRWARQVGASAEFERKRLEAVLLALPVPVARFRGADHVLDLVNPSFGALFAGRDLLGKPLRKGLPELASQGWIELFDRTYGKGSAQHASEIELVVGGEEPEVRWFSLTLQPQAGIDGAVEGVLAVAVDVTELVEARKSAENSAWRSERLKSLASALSRVATIDDLAKTMLEQALHALGGDAGFVGFLGPSGQLEVQHECGIEEGALARWRRDQNQGAVPVLEALERRELVLVESWAQFAAKYPESARHSPSFGAAASIPLLKDGGSASSGVIWIAFRHSRRFTDSDREFLVGLSRQCTQGIERATVYEKERLARAEAENAVQVRDEFLSIASHELKTPITSLQLQIQRLSYVGRGRISDVKMIGAMRNAERSIARLSRLVDNLLDVSQLSSDRLVLDIEEVDLGQTVVEVAERMEGELARSGSELRVRSRVPVIGRWDRMRVEQIASNLLSNAIKFGASRPIEVDIESRGREAWLIVRDSGLGIPVEDQQRIFKRLERAVSPHHFGGFGLGLWIARKSAEAMGGSIRLQSAPGFGSTFIVELPLNAPAQVPDRGEIEPAA